MRPTLVPPAGTAATPWSSSTPLTAADLPSGRSRPRRRAAGSPTVPSSSSRSARGPRSRCPRASPPSTGARGATRRSCSPATPQPEPEDAVIVAEASPSTPLRYPVSGWIEAALFVFTIAVLSIAYVVGQGFGAHPIAVVLYATTASALALLAVTGIGPDALRIVLAPQSLMVGVGTISIEIFYYLLLHHVSPALASLFVRLAIPISFVLGWVVFGRRPRRLAMIGAAVVLAGIVPMMAAVDEASRMAAAAAGIAAALTSNLRSFAAEFHPWNRRADTVHEKLRVTGLVV